MLFPLELSTTSFSKEEKRGKGEEKRREREREYIIFINEFYSTRQCSKVLLKIKVNGVMLTSGAAGLLDRYRAKYSGCFNRCSGISSA